MTRIQSRLGFGKAARALACVALTWAGAAAAQTTAEWAAALGQAGTDTSFIVGATPVGPGQAAILAQAQAGFPLDGASYVSVSSGDARALGAPAAAGAPCVADATYGALCNTGGLELRLQLPVTARVLRLTFRYWDSGYDQGDPFRAVLAAGGREVVLGEATSWSEFDMKLWDGLDFSPYERREVLFDARPYAGQLATLRLLASDSADATAPGGAFVDALSLELDRSAPPSVALDAIPALGNVRDLPVTGRVGGSDVARVTLTVNGAPQAIAPDPTGEVRTTVRLAEGANVLVLTAWDSQGRAIAAEAQTTLDTFAPVVQILSPPPGAALATSVVRVQVQVDDTSGIAGVVADGLPLDPLGGGAFAGDVTVAQEGSHLIIVDATDAAGNPAHAAVGIVIDFGVPTLTVDLADGARFGPLPGGVLPVSATVDDLSAVTVRFTLGGAAVGAPSEVPPGGGIAYAALPLAEGSNVLVVSASDGARREATLSRAIVYDTQPPAGQLVSPAAGALVRGVIEVSATAVDASSGVAGVTFAVDGGAAVAAADVGGSWLASVDTTELGEGTHELAATFTDGVGNAATVTQPIVVDRTPPAVELASVPPYVRGAIQVSAHAKDSASGIASLVLAAGGTVLATCPESPCAATLDTTALPDGVVHLSAYAVDTAGNEGPGVTADAVIDNAAPARILVSPSAGTTATTSVTVAVNVVEEHLAEVSCALDGGAPLFTVGLGSYSQVVDLTGRLDGPHEIACTARDRSGNSATERAGFRVKNWIMRLVPRMFHLGAGAAPGVVVMRVEGPGVRALAGYAGKLALAVPGAALVPAVQLPFWNGLADLDRDGLRDLTLLFDRRALVAALRAGIAAGAVDPAQPVRVTLVADGREVGSDLVGVKR